ncbi:MAG TPA: DUF1573 domain-containing protein [Chthoniobacteraceae bacterium]|nr:DUF1573 domain-containing protein [Chthoniobacteraceae bacterium]
MIRSLVLVLASSLVAAHADLTWDKPIQEFHAVPEDKAITGRYAFKNTGTTPISIKRITTSCGCTSAKLDKKTYAPGESGEIEVKFVFGGRRGAQRKMVSVTSTEKQEWRLDLRCWIQEPLTVSPSLVFWKVGSQHEGKVVKLTAAPGQSVNIRGVKSSNPMFKTTVDTVEPGRQYAVTVTPNDTTQVVSAELVIDTDGPQEKPRNYKVFARVK